MNTDIFSRALILKLSFGKPGNTRKVSNAQVEADIQDKSRLHVSKDLIDSPEFRAINSHDGKTSSLFRKLGQPSPLGDSFHLVAFPLVKQAYELFNQRLSERMALVAEAVRVFPARVTESKLALKGLFDATDYPSVEAYKSSFAMTLQPITFGVPPALAGIDETLYSQAQATAVEQVRDVADEIRDRLRDDFLKANARLIGSLTEKDDGTKKKLYDTAVTDLLDFLDRFDAQNLTDDAELNAMVEQARNITKNVDTKALRASQSIRDYVRDGLAKVQDVATKTLRPKRMVIVEDTA